jgi:hypothetical protein
VIPTYGTIAGSAPFKNFVIFFLLRFIRSKVSRRVFESLGGSRDAVYHHNANYSNFNASLSWSTRLVIICIPAIIHVSDLVIYHYIELLSYPESVNASLGSVAAFYCSCRSCNRLCWKINEVFDPPHDYKGINSSHGLSMSNGSILYNLTVPALLELNVSSIQCIAFCNESAAITSDVSYLMIQGMLSLEWPSLIYHG